MDPAKTFFLSFCILCVFLLFGKLVRARVRLIQNLFLPSSILGGFAALACGPFGLDWLPAEVLTVWGKLPGILISVVFATLFLGVAPPSPRKMWALGGSQLCFGVVMGMGQYLVALLVVALVLGPVFGTPAIFACIVEVGFSGGHGTAAGMEQVFAEMGLEAGGALGQMSATVGILCAVTVGIVLVNLAIRKGYTTELSEKKGIPPYKKTGLIPGEHRYSISTATVSPEAIEPLAFHLGIIGIAILIGYVMLAGIQSVHPILKSFPLFPLAMIGGLIVQAGAAPLNVAQYFDRDTFDRILGLSLDVLVLTAIASIRIDLFLENLAPFLIIMSSGILWVVAATWFLAPRMFPDHWFERGVTEFGMQTGVTAMGLLLLKLVDPEYKTGTATAFGFKQMVYEPFMGGGLITALSPFLIVQLGIWPAIATSAGIMVLFFFIAWQSGWVRWRPRRVASEPVGHSGTGQGGTGHSGTGQDGTGHSGTDHSGAGHCSSLG